MRQHPLAAQQLREIRYDTTCVEKYTSSTLTEFVQIRHLGPDHILMVGTTIALLPKTSSSHLQRCCSSFQLPWLAIAKRPILAIDKNQADKHVFTAYAKSAVQFVSHLPKKGNLLLLGVPDCTSHLDNDELRRPRNAEKAIIVHKILRCMLSNDHKAVAFWCFQDPDNSTVNNIGHSTAIFWCFPLSQINTCEWHDDFTSSCLCFVLCQIE